MERRADFLTAVQASRYLGISLRTIQRLSKQGKIKSVKIGGRWRYFKADIERHLRFGANFYYEPIRKQSDFTERRAYPRINCSIPCHAEVIIPLKKEIITEVRILNISEGGIFIEKDGREDLFNNIRNDDPINIRFGLGEDSRVETGGRVLRVEGSFAAVKFRDISCEARDAIRRYVG